MRYAEASPRSGSFPDRRGSPRHKLVVLGLVGTAILTTPAIVHAAPNSQKTSQQGAATSPYKAAHNAFGQPDLGGSWSNATLTTESRPKGAAGLVYSPADVKKLEDFALYEERVGNMPTDPNAGADVPNGLELRESFAHASGETGGYNRGWLDPGNRVMRVNGEPRSSFLTTPDGKVPPRKTGVPIVTDNTYGGEGGRGGNTDNPESRPLGDQCLVFARNVGPPMLPNGFYNNDYQIVQSRDEIAILVEMMHDVRHIALGRKDHLPDTIRPWFGDSIGHWEGETLVVETTNMPRALAYNGSWRHLKVTERLTRVGKDRLLYQYTIEDPTMWEKPFSGEYEFHPLNGQIYEYACHEGNYALEGILAGARQMEHDAAAKSAAIPPKASSQ